MSWLNPTVPTRRDLKPLEARRLSKILRQIVNDLRVDHASSKTVEAVVDALDAGQLDRTLEAQLVTKGFTPAQRRFDSCQPFSFDIWKKRHTKPR